MRRWLRKLIPSMFQRRVLMLLMLSLIVFAILAMRVAALTTGQRAQEHRRRAEAALIRHELIPTTRGRILDRHGHVLAEDRSSYDVTVSFPVISGQWTYRQARLAAYRHNRHVWSEWSSQQREQATQQQMPRYQRQETHLWQLLAKLGDIDQAELSRRKDLIKRRVSLVAGHTWSIWLERARREAALRNEQVPTLADVAEPVREQHAGHALLTGVDDAARITLSRLIATARQGNPDVRVFDEVDVVPSNHRVYPLRRVEVTLDRSTLPPPIRQAQAQAFTVRGSQYLLLGKLREVWRKDLQARPYRRTDDNGETVIDLGGYLDGDLTGLFGIERSQETTLRGMRGMRRIHLDTGRQIVTEPQRGRDVQLTVDTSLQARAQAILDPRFGLTVVQSWHADYDELELAPRDGDPLAATAVILDVARGEVLAAVSSPMPDLPDPFGDQPDEASDAADGLADRGNAGDADEAALPPGMGPDGQMDPRWKKLLRPNLFRPVAVAYQPGSTIKPMILAGAVTQRRVGVSEAITCDGYLIPGQTNKFRCWIFKRFHRGHGPLDGPQAIAHSCNIYFYTMGRRLGIQGINAWCQRMGITDPMPCGLNEASPGVAHADTVGEATLMGIGQGPLSWTPLHAADVYATLARGGVRLPASFLKRSSEAVQRDAVDLNISPTGIRMAMKGLLQAVEDRRATVNHLTTQVDGQTIVEPLFTVEGVTVLGKSGTATAAPLREPIDDDGDGYPDRYGPPLREGDHSWCVAMAQRPDSTRPDFVVVVMVEYGGSGGRTAGPIVNQLLHALRAEGYL